MTTFHQVTTDTDTIVARLRGMVSAVDAMDPERAEERLGGVYRWMVDQSVWWGIAADGIEQLVARIDELEGDGCGEH